MGGLLAKLLEFSTIVNPSRLVNTNIAKQFLLHHTTCKPNFMKFFPIEKITNCKCNFLEWKICKRDMDSIYYSTNVKDTCNIFKTSNDVHQMLIRRNTNVFTRQFIYLD